MIVTKSIRTNNFFVFTDLICLFIIGLAVSSLIGSALYFVFSPTFSFIASLVPCFINESNSGSVTILISGAIAARSASIVINHKRTFFYGK